MALHDISRRYMPIDALQRYVALRDSLLRERDEIQGRLSDINRALGGEVPVPFVKPMGGEVPSSLAEEEAPKQRRRRKRRMSPEGRARIADNGETFTAYAEPNPDWNPCDCCTTAATYGADGKLALLYREETNNDRDMYLVLSDASGKTKPLRKRVSGEPWKLAGCPMTYYTVSRAPNGYVAAWPTKGEIYFARLDHNGVILPPGEIKTRGSNGMRTGVLALSAPDGGTLIAWKKNEVLGWQLYDSKGRPDGDSSSAPSPGNGAAGVALPNGKFILFL